MKTVTKDILTIDEGVIFHQVNCFGIMGAGVALQIAKKYPNVEDVYKDFVRINGRTKSLGRALLVRTSLKTKIYVCNIFGQVSTGGGLQTNYEAVDVAFKEARGYIQPDQKLYFPYLMGCGLAGGDPKIYHKLIEANFKDFDITLCKYEPPLFNTPLDYNEFFIS